MAIWRKTLDDQNNMEDGQARDEQLGKLKDSSQRRRQMEAECFMTLSVTGHEEDMCGDMRSH